MDLLQKIRVLFISTAALLLIVMAISFSVMRILLPHATGYLNDIQQELSTQLGLPVSIKALDADMHWLVPRLKMLDLVVYQKNGVDELIHLDEANFSLAYFESLNQLFPVVGTIELVGAELFIERHKNNRWVVQGQSIGGELVDNTGETTQLIETLKQTNFSLLDSHIHWRDYTKKSEKFEFKNVDVKLETFLGNRSLYINTNLPKHYGEKLQITAELEGDVFAPNGLKGTVYLHGVSLNIENILVGLDIESGFEIAGISDVSTWVSFGDNKIKKVSGELSFSDIELSNLKHSNVIWDAQNIDFLILYRKLSNGWRVDINELSVSKNNENWLHESNLIVKHSGDIETIISSDYLKLQDIIPLAYIFSDVKQNTKLKSINLKSITGEVFNFDATIREAGNNYLLSADVENLSFFLTNPQIKAKGLDGSFLINNKNIFLSLNSNNVDLAFLSTFRTPVVLEILKGEVSIVSSENDFSIYSNNIETHNADFSSKTRIDMKVVGNVSNLDMQTDFYHANTQALYKYYPTNILSPRTISWLDDAINEGMSHQGSYVFRGATGDFPFQNAEGVMEVDFDVDGLNLHYLDGWPNLKQLDANIRFYNESLTISNGSGDIQGSVVSNLLADIPNLNDALLTVTGNAKADAENIQTFVWNSGLNDLLGNAIRQFSMEGETKLGFYLKTPLDDNTKIKVKGTLGFKNAKLTYPALNYVFSDLNGDLMFTEQNMSSDNLIAKMGGNKISIKVVPDNSPDNHESVIHLKGDFKADDLLNTFNWVPDNWFNGHSNWNADIHIPYTDEDFIVRIDAVTNLENVSINASDFINKPIKSNLPVKVKILVLEDGLVLSAKNDEKFNISAARNEKNIWETSVQSDVANGKARFEQSLGVNSTIDIDLESIKLDALMKRGNNNELGSLLPFNVPSLNLNAKNLSFDNFKLSNVRLNSTRHPQGMVINEFKLEGPSLLIDGQGSWMYSWSKTHESNFKINISSRNLGAALDTAGIVTGLAKSKLKSTSDWHWRAEPYRFSWDKVGGQSTVRLEDGVMLDISPGREGRLLGLLNILQLPKRISLDFGDVYKDGFAFDKVNAIFKLENGDAIAEKIKISAASADVRISGKIGMHDRDYNLNILVKPHTKSASFTGGTLVGGPIVGAGLVILQNLFKLDELAYDKYEITGSWDKPITKRISKAKAAVEDITEDSE